MIDQLGWFAASCICVASLLYRKKMLEIRHHENPLIQGYKRLDAHVVTCAFSTEKEAREYCLQFKQSANTFNLGGTWDFVLFKDVRNAMFYVENMHLLISTVESSPIIVPGSWQLQFPGDLPIYTNSGYIFELDQVEIPCCNPTGYYSREFEVPSNWNSRRIILSFQGVDAAFYVWINGEFVGFSKDSRLPAEFDVTSVLKDSGVNSIKILVCRLTDGLLFENQDMWNLNGIFRDVLLISYPLPLHISDFSWNLDLGGTNYSPTQGIFVCL